MLVRSFTPLLSCPLAKSWSHHEQVQLLLDHIPYLKLNVLTQWKEGSKDDMISVVRIWITNEEVSYRISLSDLIICSANLQSANLRKCWGSVDFFTWNIKTMTQRKSIGGSQGHNSICEFLFTLVSWKR